MDLAEVRFGFASARLVASRLWVPSNSRQRLRAEAKGFSFFVWELRQTALQLGESSGTKFLCPNCEQLKPFAGDQALGYYNNACGMVLVCNDCLLDFHIRRGVERVKQM